MKRLLLALTLVALALAPAVTSSQTGGFSATFPSAGTAVGTKDAAGKMQPFRSATDGSTSVSLPSYQRGAFGGVLVSQDTPVVSLAFNYSINSVFVTTEVANGGTVTQASSKAVLQTSTATNGMAHLHSKNAVKYTPGQGIVVRFSAIFTTCVANSQQEIGIGDATDGFFVGCQGANFGVFRRQNSSDTFVAKTAWNIDRMNGTGGLTNPSAQNLDITKGNVYVIEYQWLGFGGIRFFVENSTTGELQLVHIIRYANTATTPSTFNPTGALHAKVVNSGNATNLTLQTASMGAYIEGPESAVGAGGSAGNQKVIAAETAIISIQNKTTFQGDTNRVHVRLKLLNTATTADTVFRVLLNTTLGGTPSFTDFDTNTSVVAYDTAGTTVTGGRQLLRISQAKGTQSVIMLDTLYMHLAPGDVITITGGTGTVDANVAWLEEFEG